jgi:PPOX class probable F420-dependent enzyme
MTAVLNGPVRALLDAPVPAVLATINPDGSPQASVVWVGRDGDDLLVSTAAGRRKERNLRRDPRASLTVHDPADPERYAEIRGLATITEDAGRSLAVALAEQYEGGGAGQRYLDLPAEVRRAVTVADAGGGGELGYDTLVYALGSHGDDRGVPGVVGHAFDVAARPAALRLRQRLDSLDGGAGTCWSSAPG